jgi:3-oxoacyl-[acyl-carrier protein] reductase
MRIDLNGKVAIVTGASRAIGIGAAVARSLAGAGADILVTYLLPYDAAQPWGSTPAEVETLLAELRALGVRASGLEADLAQTATPQRIFKACNELLGAPSILVNNACHSENGDILALDADQIDRHLAVNVRAMALLCQAFVRGWRGSSGGRIINLSSGQGVGPMPGELAYVASKCAVEAFTVSLAAEVAPRGITVNAVDPGATDTGWMSDELRQLLRARTPLGRLGLPTDAANLICFLASEQGGWITGQVLHSRGGM